MHLPLTQRTRMVQDLPNGHARWFGRIERGLSQAGDANDEGTISVLPHGCFECH